MIRKLIFQYLPLFIAELFKFNFHVGKFVSKALCVSQIKVETPKINQTCCHKLNIKKSLMENVEFCRKYKKDNIIQSGSAQAGCSPT